jgi:hypothetical protein
VIDFEGELALFEIEYVQSNFQELVGSLLPLSHQGKSKSRKQLICGPATFRKVGIFHRSTLYDHIIWTISGRISDIQSYRN